MHLSVQKARHSSTNFGLSFQYRYRCLCVSATFEFGLRCRAESSMVLPRLWSTMVFIPSPDRAETLTFCTGLDLARLADLPDDVITEARRVSDKLTELEARKNEDSKSNKIAIRRKALLRVKLFLCALCLATRQIWLAHRRCVSLLAAANRT